MLDDRYIGKYKNDIVIEEDNSFKKIGERYFEIHSVEEDGVRADTMKSIMTDMNLKK